MPDGGVLTRPSNAPKPAPRRSPNAKGLALAFAALVAVFVIGFVGWLIRGAEPSRDVRVSTAFAGTVTLVGNSGTSGCIKPDSGGATICSGFYTEVGSERPKVGQRVDAAEEWARTADGGYANLLLIYTPTA